MNTRDYTTIQLETHLRDFYARERERRAMKQAGVILDPPPVYNPALCPLCDGRLGECGC